MPLLNIVTFPKSSTVDATVGYPSAHAADADCHPVMLQAIRKLRALGPGFGVITVGGQRLVSSVPHSLNTDTNAVLELAQVFSLCSLL